MNIRHSAGIDMCSGGIFKNLVLFSLPLILSGIVQRMYNMIDAVVIGQYEGDAALAAVGATSSLFDLMLKLFIGLSIGASAVIARYYGSKDLKRIKATIHTAVKMAVLCGILIGVVGFVFSRDLLTLMNTPQNIMDEAVVYLKIYLIGTPGFLLYNFITAILSGLGDTKKPLWCLVITGCLHLVLNLIFVGVFHLGVFGVGLAGTISQYVSAAILLVCIGRLKEEYRFCWRDCLKTNFQIFKQIILIGIPAGVQGTAFALSSVFIQSALNRFDYLVIAGNTAAANLCDFMDIASFGIYSAALTFVAQNYGAGNRSRLRRGIVECTVFGCTVSLILGLIFTVLAVPLLHLFTKQPKAIDVGVLRIKLMCLPHFLNAFMDTMSGSLRGLGKSVTPMIVCLTSVCMLRTVWIFTVFQKTGTIESLYICYPITWILAATLNMLCLVFYLKKVLGETSQMSSVTACN